MNSADYPRCMFHREHEMVIVQSEEEEVALGAGWSRTIPQPEEPIAPPPSPDLPEEEEPEEGDPSQDPDEAEIRRRLPGRSTKTPAKRRA